jgi:hypothetical protein
LRNELRSLQPRVRGAFLILNDLIGYGADPSAAHGRPANVIEAERAFDDAASSALLQLADTFAHKLSSAPEPRLRAAYEALKETIESEYQPLTPRAKGILDLSGNLVDVLETLIRDIRQSEVLSGK